MQNLKGSPFLLTSTIPVTITTTTIVITLHHHHPLPHSASHAMVVWAGLRGRTCVGSAEDTTKRVRDMLASSTPTSLPPTSRRRSPAPATDQPVGVFDEGGEGLMSAVDEGCWWGLLMGLVMKCWWMNVVAKIVVGRKCVMVNVVDCCLLWGWMLFVGHYGDKYWWWILYKWVLLKDSRYNK